MHCPVCGAESTQGLNYCKRCGASLVAGKQAGWPAFNIAKLTGMFWAVAVFGLGGLMLLVGGVLGVVAMGVRGEIIGILAAIFLFTILVISVLLIWQLSRLISIAASSAEASATTNTRSIEDIAPPQLDSPPHVMPSVTEHTTRGFDKQPYEGKRATR